MGKCPRQNRRNPPPAAAPYRLLQFVSLPVAAGWQMAVPMIGMMALLMAYAPDYASMESGTPRRRSFLLLGIVASTYAVASGMFDGIVGEALAVPFNPMVLFEVAGVGVILALCAVVQRLGASGLGRFKAAGTLLLVLPTFTLGCVTGTVDIPGDQSNFIWEASIWVLVLAVFVYGMRTSLFAVRGLAVGVMWEAWCVGQMVTRTLALTAGTGPMAIASLVAALVYLTSVITQIAASPIIARHNLDPAPVPGEAASPAASPPGDPAPVAEKIRETDSGPYQRLGLAFQLSQRELEVLRLLAEGRSAKYVSEELVISFNTARSHIRHIYEKLDVHSKQELISLIRSQDGKGASCQP